MSTSVRIFGHLASVPSQTHVFQSRIQANVKTTFAWSPEEATLSPKNNFQKEIEITSSSADPFCVSDVFVSNTLGLEATLLSDSRVLVRAKDPQLCSNNMSVVVEVESESPRTLTIPIIVNH